MKKYFEYNLPSEAPYWLHADVIDDFNRMLATVKARMEKLEYALEYSGLSGETFTLYAKPLFEADPDRFDQLYPEQIGEKVLYDYEFAGKKESEKRLHWPNADVIVDTAFVSRKEWESLRFIGIGGSEAAIIRGVSHFQTETDLYHRKVGTPEVKKDTSKDWIFERGHALEDKVIEAFCKITMAKRIPETRMFRSKKFPAATANIDAIVQLPGGNLFVFEAKTTIASNWEAWSGGKIPAHYIPQMRQYPAVLDDPRIRGTFIGCLMTVDYEVNGMYMGSTITNPEDLKIRYERRDQEDEEEILNANEEWYHEYVMNNVLPPIKGDPEKEINSIRKFVGNADANAPVQIWELEDYKDVIDRYLNMAEKKSILSSKVNDLDKELKLLSAELIQELGTNIEANIELGNNEYYEIKYSPRKKTVVDSDMLRQLIHGNKPNLPDEMYDAMLACFKDNHEYCRVFTLNKKVHKVKKAKKTKNV